MVKSAVQQPVGKPTICVVGVSHANAGVERREALTLTGGPSALLELGDFSSKDELVVISTCNRMELVAASTAPDLPSKLIRVWAKALGLPSELVGEQVVVRTEEQAVRHVFRVASGLDSVLLGESQILGQVKQAYARAVREGASRAMLNKLFHRAFFTAKQVRSRTRLGRTPLSLAGVAVELARERLGGLEQAAALLIGAGETAGLAAKQLHKKGCAEILIANRSAERAAALAALVGGKVIAVTEIESRLPRIDLLISAWGGEGFIVGPEMLLPTNRSRPLCCLDLSLPRTLDPALKELPLVTLFDLDDIQAKIELNRKVGEAEVQAGLAIVEEQVGRYLAWREALALEPTIADLYRHARAIADAELARTLRALPGLDDATVAAMRKMLEAVVKKINHAPVDYLKRAQQHHGDAARQLSLLRALFNLDQEE